MISPWKAIRLVHRSRSSLAYAHERGLPGTEIAQFGRRLGLRVAATLPRAGFAMVVTPVSCVRYFEFAYVAAAISNEHRRCLDVSSPRLFSLFQAFSRPDSHIDIINPDPTDIAGTAELVETLKLQNVTPHRSSLAAFAGNKRSYQCIWSISVVEHIDGSNGDAEAMHMLLEMLEPGGKLLVTVPVARSFEEQFRDTPPYGKDLPKSARGYFFQRVYDEERLKERLFSVCSSSPRMIRWFGEREPGWFDRYEALWQQKGHELTWDDPKMMVENFREYEHWAQMPGKGICCFTVFRPT